MKNIALQSKTLAQNSNNAGSRAASTQQLNEQLDDDISKKCNKIIKTVIPSHMIRFKNKSERERYLRVVKCIIGLPSHGESIFIHSA